MKFIRELIITLLIAAAGYLGWQSYNDRSSIQHSQRMIDSLTIDKANAIRRMDVAIDSGNHYKTLADTWFREAQRIPKNKIIIRTIYAQDTARNRNLSQLQRDSIIRAALLR